MAITYLGTIVDTNGDFDELFNELKDKVKSIDLSMVNDMFDLSNLFIDVDTDKLTINLGNNTENKLQSIVIFREDGQIKGLNVSEVEINNDILNGHFELLPDENISAANYNGCLDLNGIGGLIKAALNNYNKGEIEFSGKAKMSFIGIGLATVNIECKLDFDYEGKLRGYIYIHMPKVVLATNNETDSYIYIQNDMVYVKRTIQKTILGINAGTETETRKMTLSAFGKDIKAQIVWILNFASLIENAILNAETVDVKLEEVLKSYKGSSNTYEVTLNGDNLVGSSAFGEIDLKLYTTEINEKGYISKADIACDIASVLSLDVSLDVNNGTIGWSFFPSLETLNKY